MKQKLGILSLGCPRNLVDSEGLAGRLASKGFSVTQDISQADTALVNTCAFIEDAKRESIDAILDLVELKKQGKLKKIIVYGCLVQRYKEELKRQLPEVDAFVGTLALNHETKRFTLTPRYYAYLKICEGCVNNCSYCIVPKIKGRLISCDEESIINQARRFNAEGIAELNIIGQDITGFGMDYAKTSRLTRILEKIVENTPRISWIRLLYLNPRRVTEDLLKLVRDEKRICKYIDLPIQHINNRILRLMRRGITEKEIIALIEKIRKIIPGVCLRTSLIVGFPGETDTEFRQLLRCVEEVKFERLGVFTYSREEGTPAYDFKEQVPEEIKEKRFNMIMSAQQKVSAALNSRFLGKRIPVLIESQEKDTYLGRSQYDAPEVDGMVYVRSSKPLKAGKIVDVKITDTLEYDLVGEIKL